MNRRVLAVLAVPFAVLTGYALWAFEHRWIGEWNWTVDTITGTTVLTGPLAAAAAAWLAMDAARLAPLTAATPRAWAIPGRQALQVALLAWGVYAVGAAAALAITALSVHGGPADLGTLALGPAVLALCALIGTTAGTLAPYRLTSLLAGAGVFLFGAFGPDLPANLLRHGPSSGSLAGLRYDPVVAAAQGLALLGLIVVLVGALPVLAGSRRRRLVAASIGLGVLGATVTGVALTVVAGTDGERFALGDERADACRGEAPRVCVAPSNRVLLDRTARALRQGAERMRAKGLEPAARYEQLLPGRRPSSGAGMLTRLAPYEDSQDRSWVWAGLLTPAACAEWTDPTRPPPDAVFEAQSLLEAWIVAGAEAADSAWSADARAWLARSDSGEARAWARTTYDALRSCDLAAIRLPYPAAP